jgi:hypothetical protein
MGGAQIIIQEGGGKIRARNSCASQKHAPSLATFRNYLLNLRDNRDKLTWVNGTKGFFPLF